MSEFYYITVTHDDIKFYYEPSLNSWYPESSIEYLEEFVVPHQTVEIFKRCAKEMWGNAENQLIVEPLSPHQYS